MEFFDKFCDPTTIQQLTLSQKMLGSLFVTLLGMGTTFIGLIVIQYMIQLTSKIIKSFEGKEKTASIKENNVVTPVNPSPSIEVTKALAEEPDQDHIDEELVAVITAAVAAVMGQKTSNIIISNIRRVESQNSAWSTAGRTELQSSRF